MLRLRIRELGELKGETEKTDLTITERQMNEANSLPQNTPATPSNLATAPVESTEVAGSSNGAAAEEEKS